MRTWNIVGGFALIAVSSAADALSLRGLSATVTAGATASDNNFQTYLIPSSSWTGSPTGLSESADAIASGPNSGFVSAFAEVTAAWSASGLTGTVALENGWDFEAADGEMPTSAQFSMPSWTYTFTPDVATTFTLTYAIVGTGNYQFGLQGYTVNIDGNGIGTNLSGIDYISNPTNSGVFSTILNGGVSHRIELIAGGNVGTGTLYGAEGTETGQFSFVLGSSVPEAASWVLMIVGFGMTGSVARRGRRLA